MSGAAIAAVIVLSILAVIGVLLVVAVVLAAADEARRQRVAREQALAEARLHHLTHTTMQRMFEAARQSQRS